MPPVVSTVRAYTHVLACRLWRVPGSAGTRQYFLPGQPSVSCPLYSLPASSIAHRRISWWSLCLSFDPLVTEMGGRQQVDRDSWTAAQCHIGFRVGAPITIGRG